MHQSSKISPPARFAVAIAVASLLLTGCGTVGELPARRLGSATLTLASGQPAGSAQILIKGSTVMLTVGLTGIAPGAHGIHLHTTGDCHGPDFASAGGHLNPLGRHHGSLASDGMHEGDLPNVTIRPGGSGTLNADLTGTPEDIAAWLFDADGTAIVLHAAPDDYRTDPSGNAGARIACGVIRPG